VQLGRQPPTVPLQVGDRGGGDPKDTEPLGPVQQRHPHPDALDGRLLHDHLHVLVAATGHGRVDPERGQLPVHPGAGRLDERDQDQLLQI
jgi:hypothetical protein